MKALWQILTDRRLWAYGLFWGWNAIFLAFLLLGFSPLLLLDVITAATGGIIPIAFVVYGVLLVVIPLFAVVLGLTRLLREPGRLFALGYAVEGPLMLLVAIRFFVVRELTPALSLLLVVAAIGMAAFVWTLLEKRHEHGAVVSHLRLIGLTLYALVVLYAALWLAFYAVPAGAELLRQAVQAVLHVGDIVRDLWRAVVDSRGWALAPFAVFGFATFAFSATLFVLMPVVVPILVLREWGRGVRAAGHWSAIGATILPVATAVICLVLFMRLNQQPQAAAFALLEKPPATVAAAEQLAGQETQLRQGLLNAFLAPERYVSAVGEVQHIRDLYKQTLGLNGDAGIAIEHFYEVVAAPLLYEPVGEVTPYARQNETAVRRESSQAAELYAGYFDGEIWNGEHDEVVAARSTTWDTARAAQAVQTLDDREVHLNTQELTVQEHGDWAAFELHEEYQNETPSRQEVVYYLTLPESAVVTGLWLGDSADRSKRFEYVVAPRGAAQAVYRDQVRQNVDPAIVEQIGPSQYRVRVFPVEARTVGFEGSLETRHRSYIRPGPPLHLWLTWTALASTDGWSLPYLSEKRNVYWDKGTARTLNGKPWAVEGEAWMPQRIAAAAPVQLTAHRFELGGQTVVAQPTAANELPALPDNVKLAAVVDRSRSMSAHVAAVNAALDTLRELAGRGAAVDVYLTASPYFGEPPRRVKLQELDAAALAYRGGQNPSQLLAQFQQLDTGASPYDGVLVLTDGTGYALGATEGQLKMVTAPVWFVHLDGQYPLGYDDPTLAVIQASGGGVTDGLDKALARLGLTLALKRGESFAGSAAGKTVDWSDGYVWLTLPAAEAAARFGDIQADGAFGPFAARRLILANIQQQQAALGQLNTLDQLHALARQYSVVSPYSSMLVLVNDQQRQMLEQLSGRSDRFARETEEVGDTQNPFDVTAVPEPHEWLLLALGAAFVIWYWQSLKRAPRTARAG